MLTIKIHNDGTGNIETGNYDYEVLINDKVIESGRVENHNRYDGWINLVVMLVIDAHEKFNVRKNKALESLIRGDWYK